MLVGPCRGPECSTTATAHWMKGPRRSQCNWCILRTKVSLWKRNPTGGNVLIGSFFALLLHSIYVGLCAVILHAMSNKWNFCSNVREVMKWKAILLTFWQLTITSLSVHSRWEIKSERKLISLHTETICDTKIWAGRGNFLLTFRILTRKGEGPSEGWCWWGVFRTWYGLRERR